MDFCPLAVSVQDTNSLPYQEGTRGVMHNLPMIEVAAGDGGTQLVYRPWTLAEMKEAPALLPDIKAGRTEYPRQLRTFVEQFKPTTGEVRRMLMTCLGVTWSRIQGDFPQEDIRPARNTVQQHTAH